MAEGKSRVVRISVLAEEEPRAVALVEVDLSEPKWLRLNAYAELYDVDPRTVYKWAESGLVIITSVKPRNGRRVVWVKNQPPWIGNLDSISRTTSDSK